MPVYFPLDFVLVRSYWVYRMWDAHGECLYVGKTVGRDGQTVSIIQRLSQHLTWINPTHRKLWAEEVRRVDVTAFDTPEEAALEEKTQIRRCRPKYNKSGLPPIGETFAGMEW